MIDRSTTAEVQADLERRGHAAARSPALRTMARVGFLSRAAVYGVMGLLALALATGRPGGDATDSKGALVVVAGAPLGRVAVGAVGVGLAALALWLLVEAAVKPVSSRARWKRAAVRLGRVFTALAYGSLAVFAAGLAFGEPAGRHGDAAARSWTARALELPAGRALVAAGGAIVLAVGVKQLVRGVRRKFREEIEDARMGEAVRRWADRLGTAGLVAQGAVIGLVGVFFVQAALERDPREATGFDGALTALSRQPAGMALLGVVAAGLLAYAAFAVVEWRYRRLTR